MMFRFVALLFGLFSWMVVGDVALENYEPYSERPEIASVEKVEVDKANEPMFKGILYSLAMASRHPLVLCDPRGRTTISPLGSGRRTSHSNCRQRG